MLVKVGAVLVLAAAVSSSATLRDSTLSFRQTLAACPGALGSVSFALGHARVAASPGIDTYETDASPNGTLHVTLQNASGSAAAAVSIDQRRRMVSARHIRAELNRRVACILAD